jgi:D-amino-acid dehydrogenase
LLSLAALSRQSFDAMMAEEKLDCDFSATGKLVLYSGDAAFAAARRQMLLQRELGSTQEAVNADRCVEIEPALKSRHAQITGAIYTPGECAADCQKTCDGLFAVLRRRACASCWTRPVEQLVQRGESIAAVATPQGHIEADRFVMALGAELRPHGAARWVCTCRSTRSRATASRWMSPPKIHAAPTGQRDRQRAQGGVRPHRLAPARGRHGRALGLRHGHRPGADRFAESLDPDGFSGIAATFENLSPWAGMRPATPTGLPVIGTHAKGPDNLLFNTGHGALGFTLAFGSAQRINRMIGALITSCSRPPRSSRRCSGALRQGLLEAAHKRPDDATEPGLPAGSKALMGTGIKGSSSSTSTRVRSAEAAVQVSITAMPSPWWASASAEW